MDFVRAMRSRVYRHFLVTFGGAAVGIVLATVGPWLVHALIGKSILIVFPPIVGLALIPVIGLTSTVKNLRCPKCERNVASRTAVQYSLFAGVGAKDCPHCHTEIFPAKASRRVLLTLVVAAAVGVLFAAAVAAIGMASRHS